MEEQVFIMIEEFFIKKNKHWLMVTKGVFSTYSDSSLFILTLNHKTDKQQKYYDYFLNTKRHGLNIGNFYWKNIELL